jgi:cyclophilin family peptidyl-prolyl cis-trans isomerase
MKDVIIQIALVVIASAALVAGLVYLTYQKEAAPELLTDESGEVKDFTGPYSEETLAKQPPMEQTNQANPIAVFTTNRGVVEIELYADLMPITVGNFTKLAGEGFYNGTKFHRVIKGFMIQGGDPNTKTDDTATYGTGGPGYTIQDEFVANPLLTNKPGTIAMANTGQPNSGGSQFFINTAENTFLDFDKEPLTSRHPVFGHVISGMDVVTAIESTPTGPGDQPVDPAVIESVTLR